jgi:chemotaxis protein methyltransferase CheR
MSARWPADAYARTEMTDAAELLGVARDRLGLKPALSAPKIEALLRAIPVHDRRAFCRDVVASDRDARAWRTFTEALLVHETYFFRHPEQLRHLADVLLPRLLQDRLDAGSREMRIWCAGCASGEEVYTLALVLRTAIARSALPDTQAWNATILGTDLSTPMLELAREGSYALVPGLNSFRDVPEFARHHFTSIFTAAATTWSASAELRRWTRFARHNLVTDPPALSEVDLVVCRNTLIYFDEAHSRSALASLEAALRPSGALLLGPAETASETSCLTMVCTEQAVFWMKRAAQ